MLFLGEYIVDTAASASKASQEAVHDAAHVAKEYAAAGAEKTQEVFNEYVSEIQKRNFFFRLSFRLHLLHRKH